MKMRACSILIPLLTATASFAETVAAIPPEKTTAVVVSNRDVNRLSCSGPIQEVFWSQEKPMSVSTQGTNAFVKFLIKQTGNRIEKVSESVELHLVCADQVYTLILHPRDQDATTVRLGRGKLVSIAETAKEWGALALETKVRRLTLAVYLNELLSSFAKRPIPATEPRRGLLTADGLSVSATHDVLARGTGLIATEYSVYNNDAQRQLREQDFLRPEFGTEIVSITIDPLNLAPHQRARVIILSRSKPDEL